MGYVLNGCIYIIMILVPLMVGIRAMKERPSRGLTIFMYCIAGVMVVEIGYLIIFLAKDAKAALSGMKLSMVGKLVVVWGLPEFIQEYSRKYEDHKWKNMHGIGNIVFAIAFFCSEKYFHIIESYELKRHRLGNEFCFQPGIYYILYEVQITIVLAHSMYSLFRYMKTTGRYEEKMKYVLMILGILSPAIAFVLKLFGIYDAMGGALAIATVLFFVDIIKYHMFDLTSNAKEYVLDHSVEAIIVIDPLKNVLYMNKMVDSIPFHFEYYKPIADQYNFLIEKPVTRFSDFNRIFEANRTEIVHADGKQQGYLIEVKDVTEKTKKREEMNCLMQEAESANHAKSAFLTHMSYEIRTPINAVLGLDEMILRESKDETIIEYAQNIRSAGKTLLSLINDILDFSKIESGEMEIVSHAYDFREIVGNAKQMIGPRLEGKDVTFTYEINQNLPKTLFGDESRVQQILINILTNAAKYTEVGNVHLQVDFSKKCEDIKQGILLKVSVRDTGRGIKQEDLEKLFQSFQRVDEEKNRNIEGTGLGLAITSKLVEAMKGKIEVESEYGKGSEFRFEVEQGVLDAASIGQQDGKIEKSRSKVAREKFHAPNAKVLVVDDNAVNIKVMKGLLKRNQVQFYSVLSGAECLQEIKKMKFDLIFMDHLMPEMDGIETFHAMREMEENLCKDSPVIALTANVIQGVRQMYLDNGFTDYLMKPVSVEEMENMMIQYLPKDMIELVEG